VYACCPPTPTHPTRACAPPTVGALAPVVRVSEWFVSARASCLFLCILTGIERALFSSFPPRPRTCSHAAAPPLPWASRHPSWRRRREGRRSSRRRRRTGRLPLPPAPPAAQPGPRRCTRPGHPSRLHNRPAGRPVLWGPGGVGEQLSHGDPGGRPARPPARPARGGGGRGGGSRSRARGGRWRPAPTFTSAAATGGALARRPDRHCDDDSHRGHCCPRPGFHRHRGRPGASRPVCQPASVRSHPEAAGSPGPPGGGGPAGEDTGGILA